MNDEIEKILGKSLDNIQPIVTPEQAEAEVYDMLKRMIGEFPILDKIVRKTAYFVSKYLYYGVLVPFLEKRDRSHTKAFDFKLNTSVHGENIIADMFKGKIPRVFELNEDDGLTVEVKQEEERWLKTKRAFVEMFTRGSMSGLLSEEYVVHTIVFYDKESEAFPLFMGIDRRELAFAFIKAMFDNTSGIVKRFFFGGDGKTSTGMLVYPEDLMKLALQRNFLKGWENNEVKLPSLGRSFTQGEILSKEFIDAYVNEEQIFNVMDKDRLEKGLEEREAGWRYNGGNKPMYWKNWDVCKNF